MSKRIRIMAAAMALCLLAGCAGKEASDSTKKTKKTKATTVEDTDDTTEPDDSTTEEPGSSSAAPGNTDNTDNTDTTGTTGNAPSSGTWQLDQGEDDPRLPGAPCRDTDEGRQSRVLYEQFLLSNEKVDVSYFAEYREHAYALSIPMGELPTDKLTLDEISKFVVNHLDTARTDIDPRYTYAFIDAGLDGDPELVFSIEGLGVFTFHMFIKAVDGELRMTYAIENWDDNFVYIYRTGLVQTESTEGGSISMQTMKLLDADGQIRDVMTQTYCFSNYETLHESLAPIDNFHRSHNGQPSLVVARLDSDGEEPVYTAVYLDYILGQTDSSELNPELQQVIDNIDDLKFISIDDFYAAVNALVLPVLLDAKLVDFLYLST